jgi:ABC-type transporter Mla subunit MlaD
MTNDKAIMDSVQEVVDKFYRAKGTLTEESGGIGAGEEDRIRTTLDALTTAINAFNDRKTNINAYITE